MDCQFPGAPAPYTELIHEAARPLQAIASGEMTDYVRAMVKRDTFYQHAMEEKYTPPHTGSAGIVR